MKIIISADGRKLCASTGGQPLTSGSVGIEAAFVLSADYDGLAVTAVFRAGDVSVDVLLTGPSCTVPWEVLETSGHVLIVGVVGKNGSGEIVIPTIWGRVGMVECGTVAEGIDPQDPTPDIAAQLLQIAQETVARAETAETTATEAAEAAGESATAAGEAKTDAETAAQDAEAAKAEAEAAQAAAEVAQAKAEDAQGAAETAQAAAEVAQGKAEDAQGAAEVAQGKAEDAQGAAETAQAAAEVAQGKAEDAQGAAEVAQGKAEDAQGAAEVAQGKAEDAQGAAETAQQAAETARDAASSSATGASGSATTAAQQAQAAAAARAAAEAAQQAAEEAKTYAQTFTGAPRAAGSASQMTDTSLIYVYTGATSGTLTNGHWYYWDGSAWADGGVYNSTALQTDTTLTVSGAAADAKATGDAVDDLKSAKAPVIIDTASGAVASFEDGADGMPIKKLVVNIEPVQAGSGDPSPENVRPISGWTGCNVTRTGKNLIDWSLYPFTQRRAFNRQAISTTDGTIVTNNYHAATLSFIPCAHLQGKTIAFTPGQPEPLYAAICFYTDNTDNSFISAMNNIGIVPENARFMRLCIPLAYINDNKQIELSDSVTSFEPYQGEPYPITFPTEAGTVYGGTLDVVNKRMTSEKQLFVFNGGEADIAAHGTIPNWFSIRFLASQYSNVYINDALSNFAISNQFIQRNYVSINYDNLPTQNEFAVGVTNGYLRFVFRPVSIGTLEDFKAALIATPVQVLCNLINDVPFDIVAPDITTLLGENNIWADCGPVSVGYPADTKLYIQKINAPTDDDMIADTQIDSGKYFLIGNTLYLSTTVIPAGDIIIPGTNCTKTNLAAALNALNA